MSIEFSAFILTLFGAMIFENTAFMRSLGLTKTIIKRTSVKSCLIYGGVFTWICVFSSILCTFVSYLFRNVQSFKYVRPIVFLIFVAGVYVLTFMLVKKVKPGILPVISKILPAVTFNTALFGMLYLTLQKDFLETLAYSLGTGIGYTGAIVVIYYAKQRLSFANAPRAFRGIPVLLVYIGIVSLAIAGLAGYGLPT